MIAIQKQQNESADRDFTLLAISQNNLAVLMLGVGQAMQAFKLAQVSVQILEKMIERNRQMMAMEQDLNLHEALLLAYLNMGMSLEVTQVFDKALQVYRHGSSLCQTTCALLANQFLGKFQLREQKILQQFDNSIHSIEEIGSQ